MKPRLIIFAFLSLLIGSSIALGSMPPQAHAYDATDLTVSTDCQSPAKTSYTGLLSVPPDTYTVYAQLAKRGQTAVVTSYAEDASQTGGCQTIGSVTANGDSWTKVGVWSATSNSSETIFQLSSDQLGESIDANRPSLMLVSATSPACVPTSSCQVTIGDTVGNVLPPGTLTTQDSLHVVRVSDPNTDTVTGVTYYVDDQPLYTTKTLEAFDLRYVTYSNQKLDRVINYQSGQRVVIESAPPDGFQDNFFNFTFRIFQTNPQLITTLGIIILVGILGGAILGSIHAIQKHRAWRLAHGLTHQAYHLITDAERRRDFLREHILTIVRRVILGAVGIIILITLIIIINTNIVTLFKVDGHSMESTYLDGSEMFINEVPVTLAHIEGHDYVPKRGDVLILHAVYGIVDPVTQANQDEHIIKRVIGLPGEHVVVSNGTITVYNKDHPEGIHPDDGAPWQKTMHTNDPAENIDVTLGSDELFVSGDNRPVSIDSRFNGPIRTRQIIGVVVTKLW